MLKTTLNNLRLITERFGAGEGAPVAELGARFEQAIEQVERAATESGKA